MVMASFSVVGAPMRRTFLAPYNTPYVKPFEIRKPSAYQEKDKYVFI